MSRFSAPNLADLPTLDILTPLGFEDELAGLKERVLRRAEPHGLDLSDVINLETDPLHVIFEAFAERIVRLNAKGNDQIRALVLAEATGPELDHIAATYYGISRLVVTPADQTAQPPVEEVLEADDDFRARIALAPEAYTTAGTAGSYIFHVLELDGKRDLVDAAVYSADDGATYSEGLYSDSHVSGAGSLAPPPRSDGEAVAPGDVLVCVLPSRDYGAADQALLDRAYLAVHPVRPLCSWPRIEPVQLHEYSIEAKLYVRPGTDADAVRIAASEAAIRHRDNRRRIGTRVQQFGMAAALKVAGVEELDLIQPSADIEPGSKGYADCLTEPVIIVEELPLGWRP